MKSTQPSGPSTHKPAKEMGIQANPATAFIRSKVDKQLPARRNFNHVLKRSVYRSRKGNFVALDARNGSLLFKTILGGPMIMNPIPYPMENNT